MPSLSKEAALVHEALVARGLETPLRPPVHEMDNETRKSLIAGHMTEIMQLLNLDLADDSLMETPHRIAKMYVDEIFSGLDYANFPKITLTITFPVARIIPKHSNKTRHYSGITYMSRERLLPDAAAFFTFPGFFLPELSTTSIKFRQKKRPAGRFVKLGSNILEIQRMLQIRFLRYATCSTAGG